MDETRKTDGKVRSYWLGESHAEALDLFRRRYGYRSQGGALRAILDIVAETEEEPTDADDNKV